MPYPSLDNYGDDSELEVDYRGPTADRPVPEAEHVGDIPGGIDERELVGTGLAPGDYNPDLVAAKDGYHPDDEEPNIDVREATEYTRAEDDRPEDIRKTPAGGERAVADGGWEDVEQPLSVEEAVERLTDAGVLTERQAEAWVRREVELEPRPAAADAMDTSKSNLDGLLQRAKRKLREAEATLEAVEEIRHRPIPETCAECGEPLSGVWVTTDAGEAVCPDCAGVDASELP